MLTNLKLQRGEVAYRQSGQVLATVWCDKRDVVSLSTLCSQPEAMTTVKRRQPDETKTDLPCPQSVVTYNGFMAGVDKGNQLCNYNKVRINCMKYYKYIFWFLFNVSITNAFNILSSFVPLSVCPLSLKQFCLTLANTTYQYILQ